MQINRIKILLVFILALKAVFAFAQNKTLPDNLLLVTDRDYCVSGDSVWFKVWLSESMLNNGNIVHVQIDTKNGVLISSVTKKIKNNWAEGFIPVPDSLSTGQCFITAFLNAQRKNDILKTTARSVLVFNRFEEAVAEMELLKTEGLLSFQEDNKNIQIKTDKDEYSTREKVKINIHSDVKIETAVVKASRIDPLANTVAGKYSFQYRSSFPSIPDFVENNGVLISGKVRNKSGVAQPNTLVVISISADPPYFDYYLTGKDGDFHFFLKNAKGEADVVIQAMVETGEEFIISVEENAFERGEDMNSEIKILTPDQSKSIITSIKGDFIAKLFRGFLSDPKPEFEMPARFEMPFYGRPTKRVIPAEFIDLFDFQEISRELLPGVQFRQRNTATTIRLVRKTEGGFFENEPLRLLNGIPIFKNSLLASLNSTDIKFIDIVQEERLFGDVTFKGVLSVSLFDKSNSWIAQQANIFQFELNCLQPDKMPVYCLPQTIGIHQPDIRQVYLWDLIQEETADFEVQLSDLKGKVEITVEGITVNNEVFRTSKIIEVK